METRKIFLVMLPLTIAICLRVTPFLLSGLPFSVDSWPPIKHVEILLEKTPVDLRDGAFGLSSETVGLEQLGIRFFGALISALVGLQPMTTMSVHLPVVGAMTILIFYALTKDIYGGVAPLAASILLAAAIPDVILTAGVKGETYAHPLYMILIMLFLSRSISFQKKMILFSFVGLSLALTHYYTAILITAALASMGAALIVSRWKKGRDFEGRILIFPLILGLLTITYLLYYANWSLRFISSIDWLSAASHQILFFTISLYFMLKPSGASRMKFIFSCLSATLPLLFLVFITVKKSITSGAPTLPPHYMVYAAPFIMAIPLATIGYGESKRAGDERAILPLFWLAVILGLESYAIFGSIEGLGFTLIYRGLVFLLPPLFALCAMGINRLLGREGDARKLTKASAVIILMAILILNLYSFYAAIFMQERYMGYFWLYRAPEYKAGVWISNIHGNKTITGDVKYAYLLRHYFGLNYDEFNGLLFLSGKRRLETDTLITYDLMARNGYVVYGGYSVDLPGRWIERVYNLSLIYSSGVVNIYTRR